MFLRVLRTRDAGYGRHASRRKPEDHHANSVTSLIEPALRSSRRSLRRSRSRRMRRVAALPRRSIRRRVFDHRAYQRLGSLRRWTLLGAPSREAPRWRVRASAEGRGLSLLRLASSRARREAFRSEPETLSQDAILSLIVFGDENGSVGSSPSATSADNEDVNKAAGVAGGLVTQGINKAIAGVTDVDITTRVDTSEAQNPRPELAVLIAKDVSATIAHNLGLPPAGQNPDRTQVIVDYRFVRNWSLMTTFGDAGSSIVDLLWQYRY